MSVKIIVNGKVAVNSEELIQLSDSIIAIIQTIENEIYPAFQYLHGSPFYEDGECMGKVERIISVSSRTDTFGMNVEQDLYGKIQMLSDYYSLLHGYCLDTISEYALHDEKAANYIKQLETSIFGGSTNE